MTLRQGITGAGLAAHWRDPGKRAQMRPEAVWEVEQGQKLTAFDLHAASVTRTAWYHCVRGLFERFDVLALPAAQVFPFDAGETWPRRIAGQQWTPITAGWRWWCRVRCRGAR